MAGDKEAGFALGAPISVSGPIVDPPKTGPSKEVVVPATEVQKSTETSAATTPVTKHEPKRVQDFAFYAKPNGWFRIPGNNFRSGGTVTIAGQQAETMSWGMTEIEGIIPKGVTSGEVIVHVDDTVKQYGYFKEQ